MIRKLVVGMDLVEEFHFDQVHANDLIKVVHRHDREIELSTLHSECHMQIL